MQITKDVTTYTPTVDTSIQNLDGVKMLRIQTDQTREPWGKIPPLGTAKLRAGQTYYLKTNSQGTLAVAELDT